MTYSYKYKRKDASPWYRHLRQISTKLSTIDTSILITTVTILTYVLVVFIGAYVLLRRTGILPPNAFRKLIWRIFVYAIPPSLVLALERKELSGSDSSDPFESENSYAATRTFGAKSQAIKRILGMGRRSKTGTSSSSTLGSGMSIKQKSQALPGLFNRDNECYQNSIIQGLASLSNFSDFVLGLSLEGASDAVFTAALQAIISGLNSAYNRGRGLWTPSALKRMRSWQQQDAQEYYSRIIDEMEKEIKKVLKIQTAQEGSLPLARTTLDDEKSLTSVSRTVTWEELIQQLNSVFMNIRNPLEGLQAQRVGCLTCGYVDGLSLIPFNCITVSLGHRKHYNLESLLSSYTDLETIPGVECAKCTLIEQQKIIQRLTQKSPQDNNNDAAFQTSLQDRLQCIQTALKEEDFSDATLAKKCHISGKARVVADKTKQAVIARAPQSLVIHVNRSVFDERTGTQLKNNSRVQFPMLLNLDPWCLGYSKARNGDRLEVWETDPSISMLEETENDDQNVEATHPSTIEPPQACYSLRALITHYGTHGDGHYVSWRQNPASGEKDTRTWWRLSDDDVVQFDEDVVLEQGHVFMLFYERIPTVAVADAPTEPMDALAQEKPERIVIDDGSDSPTSFLSSEIKAALDEKLNQYTAHREAPVTIRARYIAQKPNPNGIAPAMRTASEPEPFAVESGTGVLNAA